LALSCGQTGRSCCRWRGSNAVSGPGHNGHTVPVRVPRVV
jgi:hypothetical protein